ncbi:MAG: rRNA cytosine-C5-methyltransferase [Bacteroidales bacterium]|nr:rRNA cytosine-C5-methyltransferase [Bacteroidales bacterium]
MDGHALALSCMGAPASVSVRINPFKAIDPPQGASRVEWSPYGYVLESRPQFTLDPLFHAGCYYVQDSSAMFVGELFRRLAPSGNGLRVLDLCAAPGGKTTDLAASLRLRCGDGFLLVANEVMRQRASVLCDNVTLWGDPNVVVTSVDPAAFASLGSFFDVIVADVPCSGEGMFRKDPRAVEEWSPDVVKLCASRQKRILADVWPALRQGGLLIYSTCTFEEAENDCNLEWAAQELGGRIIPPFEAPSCVRTTRCGHLLVPGEVPGEGQWAGALVKESEGGDSRGSLSALRPLKEGVRKGVQKGKDFVPDCDYALSLSFDRSAYPLVELDRETALAFLHRDSFRLPDAPQGYLAVCYQGHPLGFVKNLGNRCNNLLPQARRIRMNIY